MWDYEGAICLSELQRGDVIGCQTPNAIYKGWRDYYDEHFYRPAKFI